MKVTKRHGVLITDQSKALQSAATDFRYLLDHGYPRKAALDLIGNRYELTADQRHLLHRGVFSETDSRSRRRKRVPISKVNDKILAIDGYNVIITIEAALAGRPLVLGDDGFVRDISGLSGAFKRTRRTEEALQSILDVLKSSGPSRILFLFDAPISKSGELAKKVRAGLEMDGLRGDALAVRVPEDILIGFPGIVATSDTAIIDRSVKVIDLAGHILATRLKSKSILLWKRKGALRGDSRR